MEREKTFESKNGVKVYCYKNPALHSFYISLFVRAGSLYEGESESGITHFFEHATIRNINKLYEMRLYSELDKRGLEFNASTFSEMVQFYIGGSSGEFKFGSDVITKVLEPLALSRDEIDAERKRIKSEIREGDEKTSLLSFTASTVFGKTPLSRSILGTNKAIDRLSLAKLEDYRKRVLSGENIFFYVTGSFDDADIIELISLIDNYPILKGAMRDNVAEVPVGFGKRPRDVYIKNADYTILRFTFDIDMTHFSVAEIDLLYDILLSGYNSRLFSELSEKRGLCYDITGGTERYKNIGTFHFSFEMKERDIYDAVAITACVLSELKSKTLLAEECMKAGYVTNAYMLYDDFRELNFTFAYDNHIMGENYKSIEDRIERYRSVTPERIREVARELFTLDNLTLTAKGNKKRIDKERILAELTKIDDR